MQETLSVLSGQPSDMFNLEKIGPEKAWEYLDEAINNGNLIGVETMELEEDEDADTENDYGLRLSHSYTVLGTYVVMNKLTMD